ncbi:phosphoglycolate phosphatase [Shimia sp. W99]
MASVIFDLDGTLVDSLPDIHAAVNRMLAAEGQYEMDRETVQSFVGNGLPKLVERVMAARRIAPVEFERLHAGILADYETRSAEFSVVYPGVRAALEWLQADGMRLGVCTNKPKGPAVHLLTEMGLADLFEVVVGGDSTREKKPHPLPLTTAIEALGEGAVLYVGDSEIDAAAAAAVPVEFALFTKGYRKVPVAEIPHLVSFDYFQKLPDIVRKALS